MGNSLGGVYACVTGMLNIDLYVLMGYMHAHMHMR